MSNCIFEIRQGRSRVLGVHRADGAGSNQWLALCLSLRDARDSLTFAGRIPAGEAVVTIGVLDLPAGHAQRSPVARARIAQ